MAIIWTLIFVMGMIFFIAHPTVFITLAIIAVDMPANDVQYSLMTLNIRDFKEESIETASSFLSVKRRSTNK